MSWELQNQNKVMILIPHRGESDYRQWRDWFLMRLQKPPGTTYLEIRGLSLTTMRTKLVLEALKTPADHFLLLDDDIIAPDDALVTMLQHRLPIVSALYWAKKRKEERGLAAWMNVNGGYLSIDQKQDGRLVEVSVLGLGCVLINRSVFERTSQPWFVWDVDSKSEDFYFFEKVFSELGIRPTVDLSLKCDHIGVFRLTGEGEFTTLER